MRYTLERGMPEHGETEVEVHFWTYLDSEELTIIAQDTDHEPCPENPDEMSISEWVADTMDIELQHRAPGDNS